MFRQSINQTTAAVLVRLKPQGAKTFSSVAPSLPPCLLGPGLHLPSSPVVGSRSKEFKKVSYATTHNPTFRNLSYKIYDIQYRLIIPCGQREEASIISRRIFLNYIARYQPFGLTESNIVQWGINVSGRSINNVDACFVEKTPKPHLRVAVTAEYGSANIEQGFYFPPHLVAYHELMHAEECKKNFFQSPYGIETITTIKTIMLLDEVNKEIKGTDINTEIDYRRSVVLSEKNKIPLGKFANFYRSLEKKYQTLGDAIVSKESQIFLECRRNI